MRRIVATAALLGVLLALVFGAVAAQPASAAPTTEIEIVTSPDPELSSSTGSQVESAVVATFVILLIAASSVGPWLARTRAAELDRRLRPITVRTDDSLIRRQH